MKRLLLAATILALIGLNQPAFAHRDEDHGAEQQHHQAVAASQVPTMSAEKVLTSIQTGMASVKALIEAGTLETTHEEIEKIDAAVKALKAQAVIPEAKKVRFDSSISQLTAQLGKLHTATDAKDVKQSRVEFKKAEGALKLVQSNLK